MAKMTYAITQKKMELRSKAIAANSEDLPFLETHRTQLDGIMVQLKELAARQASLTADKQEVSKQLAELAREARKLLTFVDVAIKQRYGNQAEKLVEFGVKPFRSAPRLRVVGPDGEPVKRPRKQ